MTNHKHHDVSMLDLELKACLQQLTQWLLVSEHDLWENIAADYEDWAKRLTAVGPIKETKSQAIWKIIYQKHQCLFKKASLALEEASARLSCLKAHQQGLKAYSHFCAGIGQ